MFVFVPLQSTILFHQASDPSWDTKKSFSQAGFYYLVLDHRMPSNMKTAPVICLDEAFLSSLLFRVIEQLGGKQLVMNHMHHEDLLVRYKALLAVQKLMVHNWWVEPGVLNMCIKNIQSPAHPRRYFHLFLADRGPLRLKLGGDMLGIMQG